MKNLSRGQCLFASAVMTVILALGVSGGASPGEDEITHITFETFPEGIRIQSNPITLQGDTNVQGALSVDSVIFPDGTIQTSAALSGSLSVNAGIYDNRISELSSMNISYSAICIKDGEVKHDQYIDGALVGVMQECFPGDVGWIIERDERVAADWEVAKMDCLKDGMRLPEVFEFKISCADAATFGLVNMIGNWEWESNSAFVHPNSNSVSAMVGGEASCSHHSHGEFGRPDGSSFSFAYRCAK